MRYHLVLKIHGVLRYCMMLICVDLCSIHSMIYAQSSRAGKIFDSISDQFSTKSTVKDHQFGEFFLLIIAGAVLVFVAWLAYQFFMLRKKNTSPDTARGLYKKLCQVHNLSTREKFVIRKVYRRNGLDDPLPLFVEPNYFKQVLTEETMNHYHATVQGILNKLFGSAQVLSQQVVDNQERLQKMGPEEREERMNENPQRIQQDGLGNGKPDVTGNAGNCLPESSDVTGGFSPESLEEKPSFSSQQKPLPSAAKVLLNPIPGRTAYSSLVEPVHRLSTEIAAVSIQHNLTDGREMNERTFGSIGEPRNVHSELQSSLFPKPNVPSPDEMLASDSLRTDRFSPVSPTPQYLRVRTTTSPGMTARPQSGSRNNRNTSLHEPDEGGPFEDVARMETIVMGK